MKLNLGYNIQFQRSTRSGHQTEVVEEAIETEVEAEAVDEDQVEDQVLKPPSPSILTFHLESGQGVVCI